MNSGLADIASNLCMATFFPNKSILRLTKTQVSKEKTSVGNLITAH